MALESSDIPSIAFPKIKKEYVIIAAIVILALASSGYYYSKYQRAQKNLANPTAFAAEETKKIVVLVGKLMTLPSDETPTVATVNDKEKLKNQPFFAHAENGDKVLIYTNAKKAILYRPSINKIIDVAPVNIGASATESASLAKTTPKPILTSFVLRNGTSIVGLTKKFETEMKAKLSNIEVTDKDNSKRKDYVTSLLVDVKGDKGPEATKLAKELGITLGTMPQDEATPASDFLIILGSDKK